MLTRLRFRRDFRIAVRYFSDKPSDGDSKQPDPPQAEPNQQKPLADQTATEKIQDLLKKMMAQNKVKDPENVQEFVTAPGRPRRRQQRSDEIEVKTEQIEESLTKAAGEVAQAIGGDVKQTEAELLSKVLGKINQTSTSLSDLLIGMKVEQSSEKDEVFVPETRGQQVKRMVSKAKAENQSRPNRNRTPQTPREPRPTYKTHVTTVDIFAGSPLGIFKKTEEKNYGTVLMTWEGLKQRELTLATSQPPANYFQKMALWTQQGKIWKFPIDNEQGLEEEQNIHFSEHVFLDTYLEGWCPKKGPIRHFMELVCVGLSKNPFYTAQEKKDHIMWYKEYFESKESLLTEVGAWHESASSPSEATKA